MLQPEFTPLSDVPPNINLDLQRFGRRNLWHGVFTKSLSTCVFKKHRKYAWLVKFSVRCIVVLHKMWLERCAICHESTNTIIRVEHHNTLKSNVLNIYEVHDELPNELETHRVNVNFMSSKIRRAFLCEFYVFAQDISSSDQLTNHMLNTATHYRPDITSEASELRDSATKTRHDSEHKSK